MKVGSSMNIIIKKKGVTLVELIAVIGILGIVFSIIFQIFSFQTKMYNVAMSTNDVQNSGRLCLNSISEGIRLAAQVTINDPNADLINIAGISGRSKQIVQITPYGSSVTYQYIINNNKLYKYKNETNYSLVASKVNKISVSKVGSIYEISVEVQSGNFVKIFTTSVSLRNWGL